MDISQTNDNELQRAIDDITKNAAVTDNATDAVSELEAKIQNQLGVPPVPPMPDIPGLGEAEAPVAPVAPAEAPVAAPEAASGLEAAPVAEAAPAAPVEAPAANEAMQNATAAVEAAEAASAAAVPVVEPVAAEPVVNAPVAEMAPAVAPEAVSGDLQGVKEAMMRDLFPLMDKVNVQPEQKYEIYKEMLDTTSDKSMIAAAYEAAKGIADETARAEALLYLIETVDK